jgi:hypothetical protein
MLRQHEAALLPSEHVDHRLHFERLLRIQLWVTQHVTLKQFSHKSWSLQAMFGAGAFRVECVEAPAAGAARAVGDPADASESGPRR